MNKIFKTLGTKQEVDLIPYIQDYVKQHENIEILLGTDSQNHKKETTFAIVIALRKPKNGAHVLFCKYDVPRIKENNLRLTEEVWQSIEVAEYIRENTGIRARWVDIDINADDRYRSNEVLAASCGMVKGMGYDVRYKNHPTDTPIITYCSDNICK